MRGVTKAIVIGLGGTGLMGVLYTKKQLLEVYGEIPPTYKFLVFDTAPQTPLQLPDGEIKLEDGVEFHHLTVDKVKNVIKHDDIAYWFDPNVTVASIKNGAGQKRHIGRVSLFRHYAEIRNYLERAEKALTNFTMDQKTGNKYFLADEAISVYVVTSIAGGTGAGFFLDLGFICRDVFPDNTLIRAFLVLPDIYRNGAFFTDRVNMNAYGSLLELDQWMNISRKNSETYWIADDELTIDEPPFDWVILLDDQSRGGLSYDSPKQLAEMVGLSIFTLTSQVGEQVDSVWDNAKDCLDRSWKGKKTKYCGLGVAELIYQPGRLIQGRCHLLAKQIALELAKGQSADVEPEVDQFLDLHKLKESNRNDMIDAALSPAGAMAYAKDLTKANYQAAIDQCEQWLAVREADYKKTATQNIAQLLADRKPRFQAFIAQKINAPGGPAWTAKFLERMTVYLNAYKSELTAEQTDFVEAQKKLKKERQLLTTKLIPEASKRLFGKSLADCSEKLKKNLTRSSQVSLEIVRRSASIDGYAQLIALCALELELIVRLRAKLEAVLNHLTESVISHERKPDGLKPFSLILAPDPGQVSTIQANVAQLLEDLTQKGQSLLDLADKKQDDLEAALLRFVEQTDSVAAMKAKNLNQVFADMLANDPQMAAEWIKKVDKAAEPLLRYNDDLRPGDEPPPQTLYCLGLEASQGSVVTDDSRLSVLFKAPKPPSVAATNDPQRLIVLKLEAAVPAFALENIKRYREDYLKAKRDRSESVLVYHASKAWYEEKFNRFEGRFDLLPEQDENEDRKYWALGLALSSDARPLLFHRANNYFLRDEKNGEPPDYEVQLGTSRERSRQKFLSREQYVNLVKEAVDAMIKSQGAAALKPVLQKYLEETLKPSLPGKADKQAGLRQVMLEESDDLERFIGEL